MMISVAQTRSKSDRKNLDSSREKRAESQGFKAPRTLDFKKKVWVFLSLKWQYCPFFREQTAGRAHVCEATMHTALINPFLPCSASAVHRKRQFLTF